MKSLTYMERAGSHPAIGMLSDFEQFRQSVIGKPFVCVIITENHRQIHQLYDWFLDHYLDSHTVRIYRGEGVVELEGQNQFILIRIVYWQDAEKLMGMHDIDFVALQTIQFLTLLRRILLMTRRYER